MSSTTETPSPTPASTPVNPTAIPTTTKTTRQYRDPPEAAALWDEYLASRSKASRDELVRVYGFLVPNTLNVFLHSRGPNDAHEIESAAWAGLLQSVERFDATRNTPFIGWAICIIRCRVLDKLRTIDNRARKQRVGNNAELPPTESVEALTMGRVDPQARVKFFAQVAEAAALPFEQSLLVFLTRFHGFAVDDAAAMVGLSGNRGRELIREALNAIRESADPSELWADARAISHSGRLPVAPIPRRKPAAH